MSNKKITTIAELRKALPEWKIRYWNERAYETITKYGADKMLRRRTAHAVSCRKQKHNCGTILIPLIEVRTIGRSKAIAAAYAAARAVEGIDD